MVGKKSIADQYKFKVAYPTIGLTVVAIAIYVFVSIATFQEHLGITWAIFLNSVMAYILFTPMHEAGHYNISGNNKSLKWINEVIGWLSGIPLFAPFYIFRVIHFRHHAFTNDPEKDPDHWLASKSWISLIFHSTTIFPVYLIKGMHLLLYEEKIAKKVKKDLRTGFIGFFLLMLLLIVTGQIIGWSLVLQLWVVPALIAQAFLAVTFDWLPHHPHEEKARYLNTRVFDIPGLSIFLLGQNYHLVHHLYPRIPFYDYKYIYSNIKEDLQQQGVEIISVGQERLIDTD